MQQVISSLNPETGPEFVSVYIDDILVFSRTLQEHLLHLQQIFERIMAVGLKLKPVSLFGVCRPHCDLRWPEDESSTRGGGEGIPCT